MPSNAQTCVNEPSLKQLRNHASPTTNGSLVGVLLQVMSACCQKDYARESFRRPTSQWDPLLGGPCLSHTVHAHGATVKGQAEAVWTAARAAFDACIAAGAIMKSVATRGSSEKFTAVHTFLVGALPRRSAAGL